MDHEGEVVESFITKKRDRKATLKFLRKTMKRYGRSKTIVTDKLRSYRAAMKVIGNPAAQWSRKREVPLRAGPTLEASSNAPILLTNLDHFQGFRPVGPLIFL